jgi:hypothetical protein
MSKITFTSVDSRVEIISATANQTPPANSKIERLHDLHAKGRALGAQIIDILREIHDGELYTETGLTWEAYCLQYWNISARRY